MCFYLAIQSVVPPVRCNKDAGSSIQQSLQGRLVVHEKNQGYDRNDVIQVVVVVVDSSGTLVVEVDDSAWDVALAVAAADWQGGIRVAAPGTL
jgi:hypothetical protein